MALDFSKDGVLVDALDFSGFGTLLDAPNKLQAGDGRGGVNPAYATSPLSRLQQPAYQTQGNPEVKAKTLANSTPTEPYSQQEYDLMGNAIGVPIEGLIAPTARPTDRTWSEVAGDTSKSLAQGLVDFGGVLPGVIAGAIRKDYDNPWLNTAQGINEVLEDQKSPGMQQRRKDLQAKLKIAEGWREKLAVGGIETLTDPALLLDTAARSTPSMVGGGIVGGLTGKGSIALSNAALARTITTGSEAAANLAVAARNAASTVATAGATGTAALTQGSSVAADTYEALMKLPAQNFAAEPEFDGLAKEHGAEKAKQILASAAANRALLVGTAISAGSMMLPGGAAIEKAFIPTSLKGAAQESAKQLTQNFLTRPLTKGLEGGLLSKAVELNIKGTKAGLEEVAPEAIEEGGGAAMQALERSRAGEKVNLGEMTGEAAGQAGAAGFAMGRFAGTAHGLQTNSEARESRIPNAPPAPVQPAANIVQAQNIDQAIAAAQSAVRSSASVDNSGQIPAKNQRPGIINNALSAIESIALNPDIAASTQAITELENTNVSTSPAISGVPAVADRSGMPEPGISMAAGVGVGATAGPALDTRGVLAEPAGVPVPLSAERDGALNVQNIPPASPAQTQAPAVETPKAGAFDATGTTAAGAQAGTSAVETAGVAGIEPWRAEFKRAKEAGDETALQGLYDKVRVMLNGPSQKFGDAAVKQFEQIKADIESLAAGKSKSTTGAPAAGTQAGNGGVETAGVVDRAAPTADNSADANINDYRSEQSPNNSSGSDVESRNNGRIVDSAGLTAAGGESNFGRDGQVDSRSPSDRQGGSEGKYDLRDAGKLSGQPATARQVAIQAEKAKIEADKAAPAQEIQAPPAIENIAPQFKFTAKADGTVLVKGDPEAIKAQFPGGVAGKSGVTFGKTKAKAIIKALTPKVELAAADIRLGRDNQPLHEGGKPFITQKDARKAKALQPVMRVVRVEGGYALAEKTPAQLAAEEASARRLRNPQTSPAGEPIPAHAFIASEGGLHADTRADMNIGGNPRVGSGFLFAGARRVGLSMEQATERLIEEGYLPEDASQNQAMALIKRSLTNPQYTPEGVERMAEMEAEQRRKDYDAEQEEIAKAQELEDNQFADLADAYEAAMLDHPQGVAQSDMDMADAMRAADFTEQEIENATTNRSQSETGAGQSPGGVDAPATGARAQGDSGREGTPGSDSRSGSQDSQGLTAPTQQDVLNQQDRKDNAEALDQKEQIDREATGQTLTSQTAPEQRKDTSVDMFGGPTVEDAQSAREADRKAKAEAQAKKDKESGQGGMFDAPADPVAETKATLDANNVTGKERLDVLKDVKAGTLTVDEVKEAYPVKDTAKPDTYTAMLAEREKRANRIGREKIEEETRNNLASLTLARNFGESVEDFLARNPFIAEKQRAYKDWLDGKKPTAEPDSAAPEAKENDSGDAARFSRKAPDQTDTPQFKAFFGASVVTDTGKAGGKPLVVYHGTNKLQDGDAFTMFDSYGSNYGLFGQGAYFTENPDVASSYVTKGKGSSPTVYAAYMRLNNPIDMGTKADPAVWVKQFPDAEAFHEGGTTNESWYRAAEDAIRDQEVPMYEGAEMMQDGLRQMGYDGITHLGGGRIKSEGVKHQVYIAFDPEQLKSAIGNNGDFDSTNPDIRFSRNKPKQTDTAEFKTFFGKSKVVDAQGQPLVVYHGTPNASYTVFKEGAHFTQDPDYAAVYTNTSASSTNAQAKRADAPAIMPVYLSIQKPFDTRIPAVRKVFEREFFNKYGNGTELSERGLPDWTDARDLLEWIEETGQPFDGILIDEGGTPEGGHRGLSWVPVKNTQIKSAIGNNGQFDPANPDIRFARKKADDEKTLLIQHNLTAENLLFADRMGGLAVPSLAITKANAPMQNFGEITLLGNRDMADPKQGIKAFGADIYSPRYPQITYGFTPNMRTRAESVVKDGLKATDSRIDWSEVERNGVRELASSPAMRWQFLTDKGITPTITRVEVKPLPTALKPFANAGRNPFELAQDPLFIEAAYKAHEADLVKIYDGDAKAAKDEILQLKANAQDKGKSYLVRATAAQVNQHRMDSASAGSVDRAATNRAMDSQIQQADLRDEMDSYAAEFLQNINPNEKLFQGFTDSGNRKYKAHTLENVIAILKKELRGGENFNYGAGSLRAKFTPQFRSIADIKKAQGTLVSKEQFEAVKDEVNNELSSIATDLNKPTDTAIAIFEDAPRMGLKRAAAQYDVELGDTMASRMAEFMTRLRNMPTEYFEGKMLRGVGIGEFSAAVVPSDVKPEVLSLLKREGVQVFTYKKDDPADRAAVVSRAAAETPDAMFSRPKPFTTRQEANTASLKEPGTVAVQADNGGWLLAPRARAYNAKELANATKAITDINPLLVRAGVAPAQVLSDAPSAELAWGRSIGRTLGYEVIFIKNNPNFDGVAIRGKAFVSPNERHPELAVIGHEVLHTLKQTDPDAYRALSAQIRPYLNAGIVDAKRKWENANGGQNTSQAIAEEEVIADLNGAMWLDPKFWSELAQNDPSLFRKVAYKFMEVVSKVMKATSRFKADSMVADVDAVRSIIAKAWAAQAQENNAEQGGQQANESGTTPAMTGKPGSFKVQDLTDLAFAIAQMENPESASSIQNALREPTAPKLNEDIPNEDWLNEKIDYAKNKGRDRFGAPHFGATTGWFGQKFGHAKTIQVSVDELAKLKGLRGEQTDIREDDLSAIKKIMSDTGKLPLNSNGQEYAPYIEVAYNGEAWVSEGNHRIMAAKALGWETLLVEIKYFDGGQRIQSGPLYPQKIQNDPTAPDSGGAPMSRSSTDQTDTPAFKKWFGASVVTDTGKADGKPLVVYHGTGGDFSVFDKSKIGKVWGADRMGFFFTSDPKEADSYANASGITTSRDEGQTVMPVYLKILRPVTVSALEEFTGDTIDATEFDTPIEIMDKYRDDIEMMLLSDETTNGGRITKDSRASSANTHDGVLLEINGIQLAAAVDSTQIKSATGNNGQFDGENPDIRFSRGIPTSAQPGLFQPNVWQTPGPSRIDTFIYNAQDGKVDLKRVQEAITKSGQQIQEKFDARLAETLYPGRVAHRSQAFLETEAKPLLEAMARNKVEMSELADYLHARGAEERNIQIAKVNPSMPDGGAGTNTQGELMTTANARAYLAGVNPVRKMLLDSLAMKVDAITSSTRRLLVTEGLEKQETIDAWTAVYKNYVPMFRDEAETDFPAHPQGSGFSVKGSASKRATGSTKEVTNILAHVLMQREAAITRAEKNRVALALYGQALSHPNPEFWTTIKPSMTAAAIGAELQAMGVDPMTAQVGMAGVPTIRTIDPNSGKVVDRPNPMYKNMPNAIPLKVNGEDRVLMLNVKNPRGQRLAESLKNLDGLTQLDLANSVIGKSTRFLAAVNTQYNPVFGLANLTRDVMEGAINIGSTQLRGSATIVLAQTPLALQGIARELASDGNGGKWGTLYKQFVADGGQTGFKDNFRDPNERARAVEKELARMHSAGKLTPGNVAHAALDLLEGFNTTLENGVRLSAYKVALDKGMSRAQAARLARELTVDFNRKGRIGRELSPLYAFFNAGVQGAERALRTLRGPTGSKIIAGGLALGVTQALMLAAAGYDDDEIPEYVKTTNLVIPTNWTGKGEKTHILIPIALGFRMVPNTGRVLTELTLNGGKDMSKRIVDAIGIIAGSFNPLGGGNVFTADGLLKTVAPTLVDPIIEYGFNRNFAGSKIKKENYGGETDGRPGVAMTKEATQRSTTGQVYMGISKAINTLTGGNDYEAGVVSPTPEVLRYMAQTVGGGVLREIEKSVNASTAAARGDKVKSSQIPVLGRFYGEVDDDQVAMSRYYESDKKLKTLNSSLKAAKGAGDGKALERMLDAHPEAAFAIAESRVQQEIAKLNKLAVQVVKDPAAMREIDQARVARMKALNEAMAEMEKASGKTTLGDRIKSRRSQALAEGGD